MAGVAAMEVPLAELCERAEQRETGGGRRQKFRRRNPPQSRPSPDATVRVRRISALCKTIGAASPKLIAR